MFAWLHSNRRTVTTAAVAILWLGQAGGCALFDKDTWDPENYRDERAIDIEQRLERKEPIVKNPF